MKETYAGILDWFCPSSERHVMVGLILNTHTLHKTHDWQKSHTDLQPLSHKIFDDLKIY